MTTGYQESDLIEKTIPQEESQDFKTRQLDQLLAERIDKAFHKERYSEILKIYEHKLESFSDKEEVVSYMNQNIFNKKNNTSFLIKETSSSSQESYIKTIFNKNLSKKIDELKLNETKINNKESIRDGGSF